MAKYFADAPGGRSVRYGRGSQKFGQSWDRQKMEERKRERDRARAAKLYKRTAESDDILGNIGGVA